MVLNEFAAKFHKQSLQLRFIMYFMVAYVFYDIDMSGFRSLAANRCHIEVTPWKIDDVFIKNLKYLVITDPGFRDTRKAAPV